MPTMEATQSVTADRAREWFETYVRRVPAKDAWPSKNVKKHIFYFMEQSEENKELTHAQAIKATSYLKGVGIGDVAKPRGVDGRVSADFNLEPLQAVGVDVFIERLGEAIIHAFFRSNVMTGKRIKHANGVANCDRLPARRKCLWCPSVGLANDLTGFELKKTRTKRFVERTLCCSARRILSTCDARAASARSWLTSPGCWSCQIVSSVS